MLPLNLERVELSGDALMPTGSSVRASEKP